MHGNCTHADRIVGTLVGRGMIFLGNEGNRVIVNPDGVMVLRGELLKMAGSRLGIRRAPLPTVGEDTSFVKQPLKILSASLP